MCAAGSEARGFTLMELLVVLVIAGLALSLAVPGFQRMLPGIGLESEARTLAAMLRHARSQAILSGVAVEVRKDDESGGLRLSYRDAPYIPAGGLQLTLEGGEPGAGFADSGRILFYPQGDSSGGSLTLLLEEGKSRVIVVDWLSGRVERSTEEEQQRLKEERQRIERARERERERRKFGAGEGFSA